MTIDRDLPARREGKVSDAILDATESMRTFFSNKLPAKTTFIEAYPACASTLITSSGYAEVAESAITASVS